jgi:very-short-patch-repair endonuclease
MYSEYPVVKIPTLISSARQKNVKTKQILAINATTNFSVVKPSKYAKYLRQAGYGLLFISALIFTLAVASNISLLPYSIISLLFGVAAINGASLVNVQQTSQTVNPKQAIMAHEAITKSTTAINWLALLAGKVMPYGAEATAQVGVSEKQFAEFLTQYFGDILHPGYEFQISNEYKYSSDFTLILSNGISLIVEVDEPYEGKSKKPHHCTDDGKDDMRDAFFLKGNWVVIRFSEFQICAYPLECCYTIARTIDSIDQEASFSRAFKGVGELPRDRRWNTRQAMAMAERDYRGEYLKKYGIWKQQEKQPVNKSKPVPSSKASTVLKKVAKPVKAGQVGKPTQK